MSDMDHHDAEPVLSATKKAGDSIRGVDPFFSLRVQSRISPDKDDHFAKSTHAAWKVKGRPLLEEVMYPSLLMFDSPGGSAASSPEKESTLVSPLPSIYESPDRTPSPIKMNLSSSSKETFSSPDSPSRLSPQTKRYVAEYQRVRKFEIEKLKNSHDRAAREMAAEMVQVEKEDEYVEGKYDGVIRWKLDVTEAESGIEGGRREIKPTERPFGYHRVGDSLDTGFNMTEAELRVLEGEIDIEGEIFRRGQMKQKYRMELYAKAKAKKDKEERERRLRFMSGGKQDRATMVGNDKVISPVMAPTGRRRSTITRQQVQRSLAAFNANLESKNEHDLYGPMVEALDAKRLAVARGERQVSTSVKTDATDDEVVVVRERVYLNDVLLHADSEGYFSELNDGVLLYRVQNEINKEQEEDSDDDDDLAAPGASSRKASPSLRKDGADTLAPADGLHILRNAVDAKRFPNVASYNLENRSKKEIKQLDAAASKKAEAVADSTHIRRLKRAEGSRGMNLSIEQSRRAEHYEQLERFHLELRPSPGWRGQNNTSAIEEHKAAHNDDMSSLLSTTSAANVIERKREASDVLLMNQLQSETLPERLLKNNEKITKAQLADGIASNFKGDPCRHTVDLTNYGIGDVQGSNLGRAVQGLLQLEKLLLKENRLTKKSVPTIFANLSTKSLMHIDLSNNNLKGGQCSTAISEYFKSPNACKVLIVSNCNFISKDLITLCDGWMHLVRQNLEEFIADENQIDETGVEVLALYMKRVMTVELDPKAYLHKTIGNCICPLKKISLAWNNVKEGGALHVASALRVNSTIKHLDLSGNSITDAGAQRLAAAIPYNSSLETLSLSQNYVSSPSCFVFANVLRGHPGMRVLDLSNNPLGEPGARSIFRTIMKGLRCFVMMRSCTFPLDPSMYNHNNPMVDSPYTLDLSEPYQAAIFNNLLDMVEADPANCRFNYVQLKDNLNAASNALGFHRNKDGQLCPKGSEERYQVPDKGVVEVDVVVAERIPSLSMAAKEQSLIILQLIIVSAPTEHDKRNWLQLLCCDLYFTCMQAQKLIEHFVEKQVIGLGGLKKIDIFKYVWSSLLDTQNKMDFLSYNLDSARMKDLITYFGFDLFKFNWTNPSGHWRFNLGKPNERGAFMKFVAINRLESGFSEFKSGREDTSQSGDWFNFRNASYNGKTERDVVYHNIWPSDATTAAMEESTAGDMPPTPFTIDRYFVDRVPYRGIIEFDYVSTRRPEQEAAELRIEAGKTAIVEDDFDIANVPLSAEDAAATDFLDEAGKRVRTDSFGSTSNDSRPAPSQTRKTPTTALLGNKWMDLARDVEERTKEFRPDPQRKEPMDIIIDDGGLYHFLRGLGLTSRERCTPPECIFKLLYLQLAATKYYFKASAVVQILETFTRDPFVQSRVVCALFSRVYDLHNLDGVLRSLTTEAQNDVIYRLGYLNCMNPLKPALDYEIHMLHLDNRKMLIYLLELAPSEAVNSLKEDTRSDIIITDLYGSLNRVMKATTDQWVRFNYGDFNERTTNISWNLRRDGLKKFLVGTKPIHKEIFRVVQQYYKLLQDPEQISVGPIEQQFASMMKRRAEKLKAAPLVNKLTSKLRIKRTAIANEEENT